MFSVNQVFTSVDQNIRLRICHVSIENAALAVVDLNRLDSEQPICKPKDYNFDEFADHIKENKLNVSVEMLPAFINHSDEKLKKLGKDGWIRKRDLKVKRVRSLLNEDVVCAYLYGKGIGEQIEEIISTGGTWKRSASYYRQINRYITYGCVENALLPFGYANCGSNYFIPEERSSDNVKRGRKTLPKRSEQHSDFPAYSEAPPITKRDLKNLRKVARVAIRSARKRIFARSRLMYRRQFECKFVDEETPYGTVKKLQWDDPSECLSEGQFYHHFNKFLSDEDKIKAAVGQTVFDKDYAEKDGTAREGVIGPTHLYEIDATTMDLHVRYPYSKNKRLSMGRAVLYVVVDVYSTAIAGIYIGFHGPDWIGAAEALINAMMDKVSFAARYGLEIKPDSWPIHHIMYAVNSDNGGEYSLLNIMPLLKSNLGVNEWTKTRAYMGVAKAVSERTFGIFNDNFIHYQPGSVYEVRRDEQDPSQDPLWDLDTLYCALILEVIYSNHTGDREGHHDFKAAREGVGFSPQAIFDFFIDEEMAGGNPTTAEDEGRIRLACLPEGEAVVTAEGVLFEGAYYTSRYAKTAKWYFKAKNFGRFPITVKWTRTSTNIIWFQTPDNSVIPFKINPARSRRYQNQTWESVLIRQAEVARQRHENKRKKGEKELQKDDAQRKLRERNEAELEGVPKNTSKSRQKGIQERKDEQAAIDKANIDHRTKTAIAKIEDPEFSSTETDTQEGAQPKPKRSSKKKKVSLNRRLQRSSKKKDK